MDIEGNHEREWATCPLTQSGFVRVSSNQKVIPEAHTPMAPAGSEPPGGVFRCHHRPGGRAVQSSLTPATAWLRCAHRRQPLETTCRSRSVPAPRDAAPRSRRRVSSPSSSNGSTSTPSSSPARLVSSTSWWTTLRSLLTAEIRSQEPCLAPAFPSRRCGRRAREVQGRKRGVRVNMGA